MSFADGLVGVVLDGRYRLDAVLGEGGMGSVFRATHLAMDRRVAVKLLKPHLTADEVQLERFVREARSTMKVDSPHAVKVLDFGVTPHKDYYMVLEYLDGRTVQRELEIDGPFAPARAVHVIRQALAALGVAHAIGIVHRDLKPDNILLLRVGDDPDYAKLLDFGVAKLLEGAAVSKRSQMALTQQGTVFGTPEFMSPEQACGQALDGRSDLYAIAATLFAMLTGRGLYDAITPIEWLTHHVRTPAPSLASVRPELAAYPALDAVLQRCLAKKREHRPATALELDTLLAAAIGTPAPAIAAPPIATGGTVRSTVFSPSTFVPALSIDPVASPTTGELSPVGRGRGRLLVACALAVVAIVVVAIVVAATREPKPAAVLAVKPTRAITPDAAVVAVLPVPTPAPTPIPIPAPVPTPTPTPTPAPQPRTSIHLTNAESARRSGNRLRQLAEADLALREDPRSTRARFLMGDALVASGDLDRGCKYLRTLTRDSEATARANAAGCPH